MKDYQIALCTAPDQATAEKLAEMLVKELLAACVNVVPAITSIYQWQGEIEKESEVLMIIKTEAQLVGSIGDLLDEEHPYEVPELISCSIEQASHAYLEWLDNCLK